MFPLHFPYRVSPCAIRFQLRSTCQLLVTQHRPVDATSHLFFIIIIFYHLVSQAFKTPGLILYIVFFTCHLLLWSCAIWTWFLLRFLEFCDTVSWRIRDQLDITSYQVLFHFFCAQHVSDFNTSIIRACDFSIVSPQWSCVLVLMCVGVSVWLGWGGIRVAGFSLLHGYQCGDTIEK